MTRPSASSAAARERMTRQRGEDTRPELLVRQSLTRLGHRYRLHEKGLPGTPDVSNRGKGWALFVHGCYWHHHEGCKRATVPANNREWWLEKFATNRERDARKVAALAGAGFRVFTVWECETVDRERLDRHLAALLGVPEARAGTKGRVAEEGRDDDR